MMEIINVEIVFALCLPELRMEGAAEDAAVFVSRRPLVPVHIPDAVADIEGGGELRRSRGVVVREAEDPAVHFSDHHFAARSGPWQGGDRRLPAKVREGGDGIDLGGNDGQRGEFSVGKGRDGLATTEAGDALGVRAERDRARAREIRGHGGAGIFLGAPFQGADQRFLKRGAAHPFGFLLVLPDVAVGRGVNAAGAVSHRPLDRMLERGLAFRWIGVGIRVGGVRQDRHFSR